MNDKDFYKEFYSDSYYFKGKGGQYFITKNNLLGEYETFLITDEMKSFLLQKDPKFKKFLQEQEKQKVNNIEICCLIQIEEETYVMFLGNFTNEKICIPHKNSINKSYMPYADNMYYKFITIEELDTIIETLTDLKNKMKAK